LGVKNVSALEGLGWKRRKKIGATTCCLEDGNVVDMWVGENNLS
jgi:hypothetical protein